MSGTGAADGAALEGSGYQALTWKDPLRLR